MKEEVLQKFCLSADKDCILCTETKKSNRDENLVRLRYRYKESFMYSEWFPFYEGLILQVGGYCVKFTERMKRPFVNPYDVFVQANLAMDIKEILTK